jgi:DNA-binding IclR family transcriptional regulator
MTDIESRVRDDRAAVDKAISVLRAFGDEAGVGLGVSELARRAGLSKSTTFRLLGMLERNGVVDRAHTAYRLGPVIRELGAQLSAPDDDRIQNLLTPYLADLYVATTLTVQLAVLRGTEIVFLNKLEGRHRVRPAGRIGERVAAPATTVGRLMLAYDEDALQRTLASRGGWPPRSIAREDRLRADLQRTRRDGIAIDTGDLVPGLTCIAAPVFGQDGRAIAALAVSGDAERVNSAAVEQTLRHVCSLASAAAGANRFRSRSA